MRLERRDPAAWPAAPDGESAAFAVGVLKAAVRSFNHRGLREEPAIRALRGWSM